MKKKYIAIISIAAAGLLFGSLVYCGISAFPELLVEEEQEANEKHHIVVKETYLNHVDNGSPSVVVVSDSASSGGSFEGFVPSTYEGKVIVSLSNNGGVNKNKGDKKISSFKQTESSIDNKITAFAGDMFIATSEPTTHHDVAVQSSSSHYYSHKNSESALLKDVAPKAAINVPQEKKNSSHKEILECSLLVVGVVHIISMLLLKHRKRKLFR